MLSIFISYCEMELYEDIPITILRIKNPSRFWFRKSIDAIHLDNELKSYMNAHNLNSYTLKANDFVAVKLQDKKCEIAKVIQVPEKDIIDISFLHGEERQIAPSNAVHLNDRQLIEKAEKTLLVGSISGICPAKKVCPEQVSDSYRSKGSSNHDLQMVFECFSLELRLTPY